MGGSTIRLLALATLLLAGHTQGMIPDPFGCKGMADAPSDIYGRPCVFPFIYNNVSRNGCIYEDSDKAWCAYEVDSTTGVMVPNR